jgi:hypothetical protein
MEDDCMKKPLQYTKLRTAFDGDSSTSVNPERNLWVAVIRQALYDAAVIAWINSPLDRYLARRWLKGDSQDFQMVCDLAGIHPDMLRRLASKIDQPDFRRIFNKGKRYKKKHKRGEFA